MNEVEEKIESNIPESFVKDWYMNWFEDMKKIYQVNFDNPALMDQYNKAYIDGVTKDYSGKEAEKIRKPLEDVSSAYSKQALSAFNSRQRQENNENKKLSIQKSYDIAISSYKDDEPLEVQTLKTAMHTKMLNDNLREGIISQKFYNSEIARFGSELIINNLTSVMGSPDISTREKFEIAKRFMEGHTGEESIDQRMPPSERVGAVLQALNANAQMRSLKKQQEKESDDLRQDAFEATYRDALLYMATKGSKDPELVREFQQKLYPLASAEDFDKVANLGSAIFPKTTSPFTQMKISREKQQGTWNMAKLDRMVFNGQVSGSDSEQLYNEFQQPVAINEQKIDSVKNRLKADIGWKPDGDQRIWNYFLSEFQSDDRVRKNILSEEQALAIANEKAQKAMEKAPLIEEYKTATVYSKYENVGLPLDSANDAFATAKTTAQNKLGVENASYEQLEPFLKTELKSRLAFRKRTNTMPVIKDGDGRVVTNDDLIIGLQLAIIKDDRNKQKEKK